MRFVLKKKNNSHLIASALENHQPFPFVLLSGDVITKADNGLNFENGKVISDYIPEYDADLIKQKVIFNGKYYILHTKVYCDSPLKTVFFIEHCGEAPAENVVVGLMFIDSYDEVFDMIDEARRLLIAAHIDREISNMAQKVSGIVRKYEKDKYMFIFSHEKLEYLKDKRFDILTKVREMDTGCNIQVTLSIGLGFNGNTLSRKLEYARSAIDMALGRGGDQAVIRDGDNYRFFGGKAKENSTNARVRARIKAYVLSELIEESENVMIMGHKNADFDSLGSSVGIYRIVSSAGRPCAIVMNSVPQTAAPLYEKLREDNDYAKKVFINADEALKRVTPTTLLIIVDTHRPSIVEDTGLLERIKRVVVFDHHRRGTEFIDNAVLTYHEPYASSTCELVTEMLLYIQNKIKLKPFEADALLAGITVDTKNFSVKTGSKTFEAAAFLRRNGGDPLRVKMFFKDNFKSCKAKYTAVSNAEIIFDEIAISVCPSDTPNPVVSTAKAADELLNILGIQASFVLCDIDGTIFISARSIDKINVQVIVEKLGGGGHQTIAGVQIKGTIDEAMASIKEAIEQYLQEE